MSPGGLPKRLLRALWLAPPTARVRAAVNRAKAERETARRLRGHRAGLAGPPRQGPVVVSGFLEEALGIGRGGRLTAQALEAAGFTVLRHDIRPAVDGAQVGDIALPAPGGGVWLLHCNPPEVETVFAQMRPGDLFGRYRIGYWAWELPQAPPRWLETAKLFHEIWTPSQFTADSLAGCGRPVRVMPHPVALNLEGQGDPARFALPGRTVNFLAMADLRSSAARKNPLGAMDAFRRAFPTPQQDAGLTVKIVRPTADPGAMAMLEAAAEGRPDIRLMTEELEASGVADLVATADVLLSLHRAEGFGLTLAEALGLGRAALATGWSGNLQFMDAVPEALVPYKLRPVNDPSRTYEGQQWAEPDLEAAAAALRRLAADAALRARIGTRGREAVRELADAWAGEALVTAPMARWSPRV